MKAIYSEYEKVIESGKVTWILIEKGEADFLQFGVDFEEFENSIGNYSTAILKNENGKVFSVRADRIRFI
jgi:hypothetical protein